MILPGFQLSLFFPMLTDLRYACRTLFRSPGFTIIAVVVLALGIGVNTAVFSVINAVLLRPLPYPEPDQLQLVLEREGDRVTGSASLPNYLDWSAAQQSFTGLALSRQEAFNFSDPGQVPEHLLGGVVTANFLSILGVHPALGRDFSAAEDSFGGPKAVLLGDALWRRRFHADPGVVGQRILLDGVLREIVGVLPPTVEYPNKIQLLVPLGDLRQDRDLQNRGTHASFRTLGRLRPGVTPAQAGQDLNRIAAELARRYPDDNASRSVVIRSLLDNTVGGYRRNLYVLLGAVACVLLIACANVANLQLTRAASRRKDLAVRSALGANRGRLLRQLLTESAVLGALGGGGGILLALWALDAMLAFSPAGSPRFQAARLDWAALGFAAAVALGSGLLVGAWPAWRVSGEAALATLHEGGTRGSSGGRRQGRARAVLVVAQMALAVVLLAGAGLLLQSFWQARQAPLGFRPGGLLTVSLSLPQTVYDSENKRSQFFDRLLGNLRALPGVTQAAVGIGAPFSGDNWDTSFHVTGTPPEAPGTQPETTLQLVSPGYFQAMGIPLRRGRDFDSRDAFGQPGVIVIDEEFAKRYFAGQDPIGQHIDDNSVDPGPNAPPLTIIGVAGHVRHDTPDEGSLQNMVQMYGCLQQQNVSRATLLLRATAADPLALAGPVRNAVLALDPELPVSTVSTMEANIGGSLASQRLTTTLLGGFAVLALILASLGLYGVMALSVTQRTRELGIRLALGAQRGAVLALVLRQGVKLVVVGLGVGLVVSLVVGQLLSHVLYGVKGTDLLTLGAVCLLLAAAALLACWLPARRATKLDPMVALRDE